MESPREKAAQIKRISPLELRAFWPENFRPCTRIPASWPQEPARRASLGLKAKEGQKEERKNSACWSTEQSAPSLAALASFASFARHQAKARAHLLLAPLGKSVKIRRMQTRFSCAPAGSWRRKRERVTGDKESWPGAQLTSGPIVLVALYSRRSFRNSLAALLPRQVRLACKPTSDTCCKWRQLQLAARLHALAHLVATL